jgi:hypothetical protein
VATKLRVSKMDVSPPETFLISERVFLAFDTERGVACVQASGWRRAYLLWTFRNFRGLPHKILNAQQRKLVEALYSEASLNPAGGLAQETLIGTVQDLRLPSSEPFEDSATEPFTSNLHPGAPKNRLAALSIRKLGDRLYAIYARVAFSEMPRTVGAWALVALMAVLGWQQLRNRPAVSASTSAATGAPRNENRAVATVPESAATASQPAADSSVQQATTPGVVSSPWLVASLTSMHDTSANLSRMQIWGPPRKMVYPDYPDKQGKVLLRAVVSSDGAVRQVRLITGDPLLAAAAKTAIRQWRYQPLLSDDRRVERETRIIVAFISDDVVSVNFPEPAPISQ